MKTVMRYQIANYLNVGTSGKEEYELMGAGFTSLDESPGAQTESTKYINQTSSSSSVTSYETSFAYEADHIVSEKAVDALYLVGRNHYTGEEAEFDFVVVELWNKAEAADTYEARKFRVSCEVSDYGGDNKQTISGNLNAVGDPVLGTFNTKTKTFTEAVATA
nr:MAG TPA: hypothetical protein [Siphoviridae sp. ctqtA1]